MDCKEIRHQLHRMAEASNEEVRTSAYIRQRLEQFQPTQIVTFPKGNHLLAEFDFGGGGKTVLLRADMDAVRVNEILNLPYKSETEGVSHKCGHFSFLFGFGFMLLFFLGLAFLFFLGFALLGGLVIGRALAAVHFSGLGLGLLLRFGT